MHILVVDDKKSVRDSLRRLLTSVGFEVSTAVNGLDGFEKAQNTLFQLYIIDHLMPLMNGITLSKNLKNTPSCVGIPILFMTTQDEENVEKLPEFSLFDGLLHKPFNDDDFLCALRALIRVAPSKIAL